MISLIKKEFIIQKKYISYYALYSTFMLVVFSSSSIEMAQSAYILAAISSIYMFVQYSVAIEDKNNSEKILNSLPISRNSIVLAKYISTLLFTVIISIWVSLVGFFVLKLPFTHLEPVGIIDIGTVFCTISLLVAMYFPIYFKFGYIKAKILNIVVFLAFFSGSMLIGQLLKYEIIQNNIAYPIEQLAGYTGNIGIGIISIVIAVILLVISYLCAVRVYRNREFS